jgi:hypothetical protein
MADGSNMQETGVTYEDPGDAPAFTQIGRCDPCRRVYLWEKGSPNYAMCPKCATRLEGTTHNRRSYGPFRELVYR